MSTVSERVAQFVRDRAGNRCEYCRMHQSLQGATFHIEHILPRSKRGTDDPINLALACPSCNLHKADRVAILDRTTGNEISLFNPRIDDWSIHFQWHETELIGLTSMGRTTVDTLCLNHQRRKQIRLIEQTFGLFPPS